MASSHKKKLPFVKTSLHKAQGVTQTHYEINMTGLKNVFSEFDNIGFYQNILSQYGQEAYEKGTPEYVRKWMAI